MSIVGSTRFQDRHCTRPGAVGAIATELVLRAADTRERLLAMGPDPVGVPSDEFTASLKTETVKWRKLVREAGIRAN